MVKRLRDNVIKKLLKNIKKILGDASFKALTPPPPQGLLKQEKPEMDDLERKITMVVLMEKCIVLTDTLAKSSQNIFAHYFLSEHSNQFFL